MGNNYYIIFCQVYLAKHKQEDKFYAVKVLKKAAIRKRNEVIKLSRIELQLQGVACFNRLLMDMIVRVFKTLLSFDRQNTSWQREMYF